MRVLKTVALCGGALGLLGCETATDGPLSFAANQGEGIPEELVTFVETDAYTDLRGLPTTGRLDMQGTMALGIGTQPNFEVDPDSLHSFADVNMSINLSDDMVTGRVDNFVTRTETRPRGFLDINAEVARDADLTVVFGINGTINGAFTDADGSVTVITSQTRGDLYGDGGLYFLGEAAGTAAVDGENTGFYATYLAQ